MLVFLCTKTTERKPVKLEIQPYSDTLSYGEYSLVNSSTTKRNDFRLKSFDIDEIDESCLAFFVL